MQLGNEVPGILTDKWLFVTDDAHQINKRVREYDKDARLVCHHESRELAVARWLTASFCPGGAYIIVFKCTDPDTGDPLQGEPDGRVLEQMRRADAWRRRHPRRYYRAAERIVEQREANNRRIFQDRAEEIARRSIHKHKAAKGIKDKASMAGVTASGLWIPGSA